MIQQYALDLDVSVRKVYKWHWDYKEKIVQTASMSKQMNLETLVPSQL